MKKYVPQLASLQAVCAANYSRMLSLIPDLSETSLSYSFAVNAGTEYLITIIDLAPYTSTIKMEQVSNSPDYLRPVMEVRLYHDARMAEVLSSQHAGALAPSYDYPNPDMRHRDEKERVNSFLAEWLSYCLKHQRSLTERPIT